MKREAMNLFYSMSLLGFVWPQPRRNTMEHWKKTRGAGEDQAKQVRCNIAGWHQIVKQQGSLGGRRLVPYTPLRTFVKLGSVSLPFFLCKVIINLILTLRAAERNGIKDKMHRTQCTLRVSTDYPLGYHSWWFFACVAMQARPRLLCNYKTVILLPLFWFLSSLANSYSFIAKAWFSFRASDTFQKKPLQAK